jgi:hypothetical protein
MPRLHRRIEAAMENDLAVSGGVMHAELFPCRVALINARNVR